MRIELIVIGSEVLSGQTLNTNLAGIGQMMGDAGYALFQETVLTDSHEVLKSGMEQALKRSDLVIATGGLGPTLDDVTRKAAAELFDSPFHLEDKVVRHLQMRFGNALSSIEDQATVPSKAHILLNHVGTAPGLIFESSVGTLILLPGVPNEMRPMFAEQVIPYMREKFPLKETVFRKSLHIFELAENVVDTELRKLKEVHPLVDFGIYPGLGIVSVSLSATAKSALEAEALLHPPYQELEAFFATNCFTSDSGTIEEAVQHLFLEKGWTLSIAESCTGGALSARITQHPGASGYFLGSIVAYANHVKSQSLGVSSSLITEKGAVSQEVVVAMARGILSSTGSDFALAVTGVAGPSGGTAEKPVGTVWCAVLHKDGEPHIWQLHCPWTRKMIITRSINSLLSNLLTYSKQYNV
jgi:nicotinamide-nucleotide amidase